MNARAFAISFLVWASLGGCARVTDPPATKAEAQKPLSDYLKSDEDMVLYLEACMEEAGDDPAFIAVALGNIARGYAMAHSGKY